MKSLVAYLSETGNTEMVAQAIYEALPEQKAIARLDQLSNLEGYDLIFFGFPVHLCKPPEQAAQFLAQHGKKHRLALFCTQGAPQDSPFAAGALAYAQEQCPKASLLGSFNCPGQVTEKVLESADRNPKYQTWARSARRAQGHPDQEDLDQARKFARRVLADI